MQFDLPGWTQLILALVAVGGAFGAHRLNRRGQIAQSAQQHAANELALRVQGFDEMEALVERLHAEIIRIEARNERDSLAQARRCRLALDHFALAFTTLQGQVVDEVARQTAQDARLRVDGHTAADHMGDNPPASA